MKIAFISYEYPPDTAVGGVGTYVWQISKLLSQRGHHVEVFAGSTTRDTQEECDGVIVHRVQVNQRQAFSQQLTPVFNHRHHTIQFDVIESPEVGAEAYHLMESHPDLPLVIKLHTPTFMVSKLNRLNPSVYLKVRRLAGALRRFQMPKPFNRGKYDRRDDPECSLTLNADEVTTPSVALGEHLINKWSLDPNKVFAIPNPYIPSQSLLDIPIKTQTNVVTYLGRLEPRKGVIDLAKAIPLVLNFFPDIKFRFIGNDQPISAHQPSCKSHLEDLIDDALDSVEFVGKVPLEEIPTYLAQTDICVFPSIWENFPNVCLEAMAAGRGIVGSSAGGMREMLSHGAAGLLVPPRDPEAIASSLIELLTNPTQRWELGKNARKRVMSEYSLDRLAQLQEQSYERAIQRRQHLGPRFTAMKKVYVKT